MKISYNLISLMPLAISFISACNKPGDKAARLWLFHSWSDSAKATSEGLTAASFFHLSRDGSFTKDFPSFSYGKWDRRGDTLVLLNNSDSSTFYHMATDGEALRIQLPNGSFVTFNSFPLDTEKGNENPFSVANNKWRIPAVKREGDAEILARLLNHVKYWEVYFKWALKNQLQTIDVRSIATPIKIYSNGFEVKPLTKLPRAWIRLFYDKQECTRANQVLEYAVKRHHINFPKTDNKFEMFISVFSQLHANISKDHQ